jgi:two-component system, chemotaxis family, chemotaxis protein CheY
VKSSRSSPISGEIFDRPNRMFHTPGRETLMKRLLVVDDALFMRKLICGVAAEAGWEVVGEAGDGAEAVALYERLRPDLVTMDLVMPVMGGLEALRQIRDRDPEAKVVVVTALDQKQALMDSIRDGAIDFIVKPFERQRVLNLLAKLGGAAPRTAPG